MVICNPINVIQNVLIKKKNVELKYILYITCLIKLMY